MKKCINLFFTLFAVIGLTTASLAAEYVSLTINYTTTGTVEGYDHLTKMRVYYDGKELGENIPKKQTSANSITVEVPKGSHEIKAVLYAKNENIWEERTVENDYSFDCIFKKTLNFSGNQTIDLVFDFDKLSINEKKNKDNNSSSSSTTTSASSSGNYKDALGKLNAYLKTFDTGYYGYMEIKDGYLYDRFLSGKYTKTPIDKLENATVAEYKRKVVVNCKNNSDCVFSTYTDSYHKQLSYSQSSDFNTEELITLLDNVISAYNNKSTTTTTTSAPSKTPKAANLTEALKNLNEYLKTFDNDRYKSMEVKNGYLYSNYKNGDYSRAKIEDIGTASVNTQYEYVKLACKNDAQCIYSTITGNYHDYFNFQSSTKKDLYKMADLLNDVAPFLKSNTSSTTSSTSKSSAELAREQKEKERQKINSALKEEEIDIFGAMFDTPRDVSETKSTSTNNPTASKYSKPLKDLNDYLKTFNSAVYGIVEVKDGKVYFSFKVEGANYKSNIDINELTKNTTVSKATSVGQDEIKIQCKGDSKCFYSEYSKKMVDHFRFFSYSVKDLTKMKQLVDGFISALK